MRVDHVAIEEFLTDLATDAADRAVWSQMVRVRIDETPENKEETGHVVTFWASYVQAQEGQEIGVLVTFGKDLGTIWDGNQEAKTQAEAMRSLLCQECQNLGLTVRPGKFEAF